MRRGGRHGNGDNRADTATAGAASTEDRPGRYVLTALQYRVAPALSRLYGSAFTINLPVLGKIVVVSDLVLVKDVYSASLI